MSAFSLISLAFLTLSLSASAQAKCHLWSSKALSVENQATLVQKGYSLVQAPELADFLLKIESKEGRKIFFSGVAGAFAKSAGSVHRRAIAFAQVYARTTQTQSGWVLIQQVRKQQGMALDCSNCSAQSNWRDTSHKAVEAALSQIVADLPICQ